MCVCPGQIAACNPTWPGTPPAELSKQSLRGPRQGVRVLVTCARGANARNPPHAHARRTRHLRMHSLPPPPPLEAGSQPLSESQIPPPAPEPKAEK